MVTRIVKIGGASITDKTQFEHVKVDQIEFIVQLFRENYKNLILIHGAGSFGHHQAKQYRLNEGYLPNTDYDQHRWAVCDTRRSLGRLQQHLLDAFLRAQVPVVGLSPFDFLVSDQLELTDANFLSLFERLEYLLSNGYVPMLHGDVLLDRQQHWRIFSGDDLLLRLAKYFRPRLCVFLTSVPGVLRKDGSIIEQFNIDEHQFDPIVDSSDRTIDVTGSMQNKVLIASEIIRQLSQCQVFIVQGVSSNAQKLLNTSIDEFTNDSQWILSGSTKIANQSVN